MNKTTLFGIHLLESPEEDSIPQHPDTFKIIWFTNGHGEITIDLTRHPIQPNSIYCLKPSQAYQWTKGGHISGYIISFSLGFINADKHDGNYTFVNNFFDMIANKGQRQLPAAIEKDMQQLVENMTKEFSLNQDGRSEILRGFLKIFIIYLIRQTGHEPATDKSTAPVGLTRRFFQLLEQNYKTRKFVADYAQDLAVSPSYLSDIVKQTSGLSANHHIQQRIVLEAKRKAAYVNMNMKEVAHYLGFDDMSHFSKYFKNVAGVNYSEFRKEAASRIGVS